MGTPVIPKLNSCADPLKADLQAIRHGTPNEALEAAKRLGESAAFNVHGPHFLEQDGIIPAVLKVFDVPSLSCEDREALHASMMYLVLAQPRLAAEVVALCADPDLRIAFAALDCTKWLFLEGVGLAGQFMLEAGAARAIVSALKHSDAYFRAAAASCFAVGTYIDVPTGHTTSTKCPNACALKALLKAGLVHALVEVLREGRPDNVHDRTTGVFSNIKMELRLPDKTIALAFFEPARHACYSLLLLTLTVRDPDFPLHSVALDVGAEVLKSRQAAAMLVKCLRQFDDDVLASPAKVMKEVLAVGRILSSPQYRSLQVEQRWAFAKDLLNSGFPHLLPTLIGPEQPYKTALLLCSLMETFWALGDNCLPARSLAPLAAAIVKYIEEGPRDDYEGGRNALATSCLEKVSLGLRNHGLPLAQLSPRCIKCIAGVGLTGKSEEALAACTLIAEGALGDKNSEELKAAMSGGFVLGILRVAREGHRRTDTVFPHKLVMDSFILIAQSGEERYILQAVKSGLLPLLEFYIGVPQYQKPALSVCAALLEYPWAPAKLREAGFVSSATGAAHSVVELGRWVCTTCPGSGLVADFVDAGLLEKLEKAKSRMKRQPAKQRDVATVIDRLSRLRGLGSLEAGSGTVQELCLVEAKEVVKHVCDGKLSRLAHAHGRAVRWSGLLLLLEYYIGMPQFQKPALSVCAHLLGYPWAPTKLREAGFVSSATQAAHPVVELGRWVCTTCPGSGLVADFVDAGLLEKAKRQMKRQPVKQCDVATLIDELSRLRGLGSPDSPEAGSGPVQELCLVKAKDKAVDTSSTSTDSGSKRPDPKRDRPTRKKGKKKNSACAQCGKSSADAEELFKCSRCESVMYCGRECQLSHWLLHKAECSELRPGTFKDLERE